MGSDLKLVLTSPWSGATVLLAVESVAALEEMTEAELLQLLLELESGDQDSQTNTVEQLLAGNSSVPKVKDLHIFKSKL